MARVSDVGRLENGSPYIVMEYLEGSDLAGWLEKSDRLPVAQELDGSLTYSTEHRVEIIHFDRRVGHRCTAPASDAKLTWTVIFSEVPSVMIHPRCMTTSNPKIPP